MSKKTILACVECLSRNYTTYINAATQSERLEARKFCKICGKHTLHRETK